MSGITDSFSERIYPPLTHWQVKLPFLCICAIPVMVAAAVVHLPIVLLVVFVMFVVLVIHIPVIPLIAITAALAAIIRTIIATSNLSKLLLV